MSLLRRALIPSQRASLVALVKNLSAMQETQVRSLGEEDPLEKEMATHSSILGCRIPWTGEPGGLQSMGSQESVSTEHARHLGDKQRDVFSLKF